MSNDVNTSESTGWQAVSLLARWLLGGLFIYMGAVKVLDPVDFLKLVRQYDLVETPLLLNFIAASLPWFEIFCGLLLVLGVAVRGSALLLVAMLIPFTLVVLRRALAIHSAGDIAFCAIKFDCGCGGGEVYICRKLVENLFLTAFAFLLAVRRSHPLCLKASLLARPRLAAEN